MTGTDQLLTIFLEAAHRASIVPLASEAAIYAMKSFGSYAMELPVAMAIAGGLTGSLANMWLGRLMMRLPSSPGQHAFFHLLQRHFNRYGFIVLFFAWVPLVNILVVAGGMLGTPYKKALPVIAAGLVWYYGRLLA